MSALRHAVEESIEVAGNLGPLVDLLLGGYRLTLEDLDRLRLVRVGDGRAIESLKTKALARLHYKNVLRPRGSKTKMPIKEAIKVLSEKFGLHPESVRLYVVEQKDGRVIGWAKQLEAENS